MSLASLLTGNQQGAHHKNVDDVLDALFRSNPAPPVAPQPGNYITASSKPSRPSPTRGEKRKRKQEDVPAERRHVPKASTSKDVKRKKFTATPAPDVISSSSGEEDEDDEDDDAGLEDAYLTRSTVPAKIPPSDHESSAEDEDADPPQHETHSSAPPKVRIKPRKKAKFVPPDETPAQRDARTIFVGNIPIEVAKSKSSQKQFKRHFTSHVSGAKIESVRFRSVAFASATAALPTEDGKPPRNTAPSTKQQRQKERAATWRDADGETSDREEAHGPPKNSPFLTPSGKKRVAFIKGDFHKEVDTVNAYVVFAHTPPDDGADALSPIEAARLAVAQCDGSTFLDRTLRVDRVGKWREVSGEDATHGDMGDPRVTIFVGNLDFAARDEDLRVWFEGVVGQVRGPRGVADADDEEGKWVQRVRIVRDRDTQLGKGFAYVRFVDRECVDEVLALERESLKFAKRTLRVQRCKVGGGGSSTPKTKSSAGGTVKVQKPTRPKVVPVHVPAGDPLLGTKLAGLSKEDRKAAKASNVDRVQRRLAKKKAQAGVERELEKRGKKVRDRERKKGGSGKLDKVKPVHKGRVRSAKSVEKRNMKK